MTLRQRILKLVYPLFIWYKKNKGAKIIISNTALIKPFAPFNNLFVPLTNNKELLMASLKNKKILLVNTASDCGYTNQYAELQELYNQYKNKLEIIAFPSNDFKEQEKGSDSEIEKFCKTNFSVSFPIAKKSSVLKGAEQNKIFQWLTHKEQNGWNEQQPAWNFAKYLVSEEGTLTHYFDPWISPLSKEVIEAINS